MSKIPLLLAALSIFLCQITCYSHGDEEQNEVNNISLVEAFPNLTFSKPVFLTHSNDGTNRVFVVEQAGRIEVFENNASVTSADVDVFLDIRGRVNDSDTEMGLLGLAFHPDFENNGFFYVNYTSGSFLQPRTVISRFSRDSNDPNLADPNSEFILLEIPQPFRNHNGGMLQFGPGDGYLYVAMGDGGSGGDPEENGQDLTTLLGAILRIDVDNRSGGLNYGIPPDNPFVGNTLGFREEIWAFGLRNPWRFSIDSVTNELWVGDVGQNKWEEVDLIEKGKNYGWDIMEGFHCFEPPSDCDTTGLIKPIVEYPHFDDFGDWVGCSITGGYLYRGNLQPELVGTYIYGDFCTGNIWMLRYENGQILADSLLISGLVAGGISAAISSFGVDENNELYILDHRIGRIYRFSESLPNDVNDDVGFVPDDFELAQNYPNPFNPRTLIRYKIAAASDVQLTVYNTLGQRIRTLVDERKEPGDYQVHWDGRGDSGIQVASGVYLCQMRVGEFVQTRKMILNK
ncbi:MAG: PQQ-dependent sugar dehydrogenase [bacterium]